jgi:putative endopeptidase
MAGVTGRSVLDFDSAYFKIRQSIDQRDPQHYAVYIGQDGLGLPDRDYFSKSDFAAQKAKYQAYIGELLRLISWPDADANAKRVLDLETAVAGASWTKTQQRDPVTNYNAMSVDELDRLAPGFAWRVLLANAKLPQVTRVIVAEKGAFPALAAMWRSTPVDVLKAWEAFHVADNAVPYLSKTFKELRKFILWVSRQDPGRATATESPLEARRARGRRRRLSQHGTFWRFRHDGVWRGSTLYG